MNNHLVAPDITKIDVTKIRGLEPELLQKQKAIDRVQAQANADPLPGSLAKAFPLPEIKVGAFSVRAPVAYDWALLKKLNSPIHRQVLEMAKPDGQKDVEFTDEEGWDICFQFTRPCREVAEVIRKGGAELLRQQAEELFAMVLQPLEVTEIVKAVISQIVATWETAMSYKAESEADGKTTNFRPSPNSPATA